MKYVNTEEQLYTNTSEDKLMTLNDVVVQFKHKPHMSMIIHEIYTLSLCLYISMYVLYEG